MKKLKARSESGTLPRPQGWEAMELGPKVSGVRRRSLRSDNLHRVSTVLSVGCSGEPNPAPPDRSRRVPVPSLQPARGVERPIARCGQRLLLCEMRPPAPPLELSGCTPEDLLFLRKFFK